MSAYGPMGMPRVTDRRHTSAVIQSLMYKFPEVQSATASSSSTPAHSRKNSVDSDNGSVRSSGSGAFDALKNKFRKSFSSHRH